MAEVKVKFVQSVVLTGEPDPVEVGDVRALPAETAEAVVAEGAAELVRDAGRGEKASTSAAGRRAKPKD